MDFADKAEDKKGAAGEGDRPAEFGAATYECASRVLNAQGNSFSQTVGLLAASGRSSLPSSGRSRAVPRGQNAQFPRWSYERPTAAAWSDAGHELLPIGVGPLRPGTSSRDQAALFRQHGSVTEHPVRQNRPGQCPIRHNDTRAQVEPHRVPGESGDDHKMSVRTDAQGCACFDLRVTAYLGTLASA